MIVQLTLDPSRRQLRQFGFIALGAFALLGGLILWKGSIFGVALGSAARPTAYVLWGLGLLSGAFSLLKPAANRPLFVLLGVVTFPIGWVLSHVVLAVLFYGLLTPIALFFRLIGRDPLTRRWEPEQKSYWVDLPEAFDKKDYFRQF